MIDVATAERMLSLTTEYWSSETGLTELKSIATGKEIGHRVADLIDERTTELLHVHFDSKYERSPSGKKRPRSMGDIWIKANGIYNPVNVKSGEMGKNGQPNMVSLKKLLKCLLFCEVDSYHLLFVKLKIGVDSLACQVFLVDMLDYLDYVTFDSGPGQIMLRERQFFEAVGSAPAAIPIEEKVRRLFHLLEDGERRLAKNRIRVLTKFRELVVNYAAGGTHVIDQSNLRLA